MKENIYLVYDKECPACAHYCRVIRIREDVGNLILVDARQQSEVMDEITRLGLDIDQGMVLKVGTEFYYGSDAIHVLALIGSRSGILNRVNFWFFKSKTLSKVLYPFLKAIRNLLLKLLQRTKINNLNKDHNDLF